MEEVDCLGEFGIEELLDFSQDDLTGLDDCSKNSDSSGLSSLIDTRSFCARPEMGWFDFENAKVLLGSSAREEEKNRIRAQQQQHQHQHQEQQQEEELLYMTSPVSVLESCATSERSAMVSISSVHAGDVKTVFASTGRSKRGRAETSATRPSYSASTDEDELENFEEEEEDEDDEDDEDDEKDADVELDEEEEDDDEEEEEDDEVEEEEHEHEHEHEHEREREHSESLESDCALSTESEVVTEEDDGLRPPPSKRQCKAAEHQRHQKRNLVAQHQHQQQHQQQLQHQRQPPQHQQQQYQRPQQHQHHQQQQQQQNCPEMASRKCSHCQTQKTPQWRAGPLGPKTLCNACGVRFKSGRLLPEYRPAGSPSFMSEKHSNSHRKVLEMRRQRGTEVMREMKREAEGEIAEEEVLIGSASMG